MNIFLIHPDARVSAQILAARDTIRARKQIVECAQLLAFFEIRHVGSTTLLTKDFVPYRATKAQLNHPIAFHMAFHKSAYQLCWNVVFGLLEQFPSHACGYSLATYANLSHLAKSDNQEYLVCRRGRPIAYAKTRDEYAGYMLDYMVTTKGLHAR